MGKDFEFVDNSEEVKQQIQETAEAGMESVMLMIEASMKSKARVGSGEMRDKASYKIQSSGSEVIGKAGSPNEHAIWNEFGTGEFATNGAGRKGGWSYKAPNGKWYFTRGLTPQPFIRPAFRENKKNIKDILGKEYGATFKGA